MTYVLITKNRGKLTGPSFRVDKQKTGSFKLIIYLSDLLRDDTQSTFNVCLYIDDKNVRKLKLVKSENGFSVSKDARYLKVTLKDKRFEKYAGLGTQSVSVVKETKQYVEILLPEIKK